MNIDSILQAIRPDAPTGDDLSFSVEFDSIAEARREEDATLDQGDWVRDVKEADWAKVVSLSEALLKDKSKDLRVAGWLLEGLGKVRGFGGLADGFDMCNRLIDTFWDDLHPRAEGGDNDERIGALSWMVQRAATMMMEAPLTQAPQGAFSWYDFQSAKAWQARVERDPDLAEEADERQMTMERFRAASAATPAAAYEEMQDGFGRLRRMASAFEKVVDERLGVDGPSFAPLREALDAVGEAVDRLARDSGVVHQGGAEEVATSDAGVGDTGVLMSGPIKSRKQALVQLRQVADFFRRTEPHSPVAYLADKAAKWGEMPLHDWLRQVVKDGGTLAHIEELLGLETRRSASEE